jgi:hypothetical protein
LLGLCSQSWASRKDLKLKSPKSWSLRNATDRRNRWGKAQMLDNAPLLLLELEAFDDGSEALRWKTRRSLLLLLLLLWLV